ncbi:hypothetical protein JCM6882_001807 [Rhodosporidiobolus microsporus]
MLALTTLLGLAFTGLAAAAPLSDAAPVTCNSLQYRIVESNTCTANYVACPFGPGVAKNGVAYRGTYTVGRECLPCPAGAWACRSADNVIGCSEEGYVQFGTAGICYPNSDCVAQGGYVRKDKQTQPDRFYNRCQTCSPGYSAFASDYACSKCPTELGQANRCTADKALSCKAGYVLYEDKCLEKECPSGWYNDNGVCKTCTSQDLNSATCTLGKSLTCIPQRLLIEATDRCTTIAHCPFYPVGSLPGSYRDGAVCKSCSTLTAYNCDKDGALNCYNPEGVQSYRLGRQCVSKEECLAAKPTSRLFTQLQSSSGVTYGTCN